MDGVLKYPNIPKIPPNKLTIRSYSSKDRFRITNWALSKKTPGKNPKNINTIQFVRFQSFQCCFLTTPAQR